MITYPSNFYQYILECYEYETRNASVFGNVILREVELTKGCKQLQLNFQGDENNLQ